ncbi:esterase/lipase family protein [Rhodococcus spelaei]|uniref:esterase/lipase family protein n=1 Tax=Rhodococcus spelaei TaxID=2546320 RepID=UPI0015EF7538|nr:alpha/beta fold hydrolase [Rhodococcus spelaei]
MIARLRAVSARLATVALFAVAAASFPSAAAFAESVATGSAGAPDDVPAAFAPLAGAMRNWGKSPAGVNDWECRPADAQHRPVVLVHGTGRGMQESWGNLADPNIKGPLVEDLANDGRCVYALNYGSAFDFPTLSMKWGFAAIENSAADLGAFVDAVLAHTGATQVDVVGHSQGGTVTREYLRTSPDRTKIHSLVMLAPPSHGSTLGGEFTSEADARNKLAPIAVQQQAIDSAFLKRLNEGQETFPGIDYTVIATKSDQTITPSDSSFLVPAPATSVHNMYVQDVCGNQDLVVWHSRPFPNSSESKGPGLLDHDVPRFLVRQALDPTLSGTPPC